MEDQKEDTDAIVDFAVLIDKYNSLNAHNKLKYTIAALTAAVAILLFILALLYSQNGQMLDIIQRQAAILEGKEEMINKILDRGNKNTWSSFLAMQIGEYAERAVFGYTYSVASKVLSYF